MRVEELTNNILQTLWAWATVPWLQIGETDVHLLRMLGLAFILFFAWWFSSVLERGLHNVVARGKGTYMNSSGMFALTRIIRYAVWIIRHPDRPALPRPGPDQSRPDRGRHRRGYRLRPAEHLQQLHLGADPAAGEDAQDR